MVVQGPDSLLALRQTRKIVSTKVRPDGFFQIGALSPGSYRLEVTHPGYAPSRVFPIELWSEQELRLRGPIVLHRPLTLTLSVSPPLDWLERHWRVEVFRASDFSSTLEKDPLFLGTAGEDGRVVIPEQAPGTYRVTVRDSSGNPFFGRSDIVVQGKHGAQREIVLELILLRGALTLGGDEIQGTVWFGGRHGGQHVELPTDEEGSFEGFLPRPGSWLVEIQSKDLGGTVQTGVAVDPDDDREAYVQIELPDTEVYGSVVGSNGEPGGGQG